MTAFGQGEAGNCASISVIKLALYTYGFEGTFAAIEADTRGSKMTLRDGHVITITDEEVRQVGAVADFQLQERARDTIDRATRILTVMARNKCTVKGACASILDAFDRDAHFLDESTENNFTWLGLENERVESPPPHDFASYGSLGPYIVTNMKHSAFGFAETYDEKGSVEAIARFEGAHSSWWTRLWGLRHINGHFTLRSS